MNLDAKVNNQLRRNDFAIIIALNRHLATLLPVRLTNDTTDIKAGTVLGRITASGLYKRYNDSNSDGSEVAACVLMDDALQEDYPSATGTCLSRGIFTGEVFQDKLVGFDAAAKVDLGGRTIIDASGVNILKF